nr:PREDICTED: taste receptor type 2 member 9-like [Opisthocomus hoazin]
MQACYSQHLFNSPSYDAIATAIITLQAFAGMWINAFIVSVLCIAWVKKKSFNSNEKILLFLGCVRFWYLCITGLYCILSTFYAHCFYVYPTPQIFVAIHSFLNSSNLWVSACLCVFYCIKIANFRHRFFIYLKVKIDRIVSRLLGGLVLLSLVFCILGYEVTDNQYDDNFNATSVGNIWRLLVRTDKRILPIIIATVSGYAVAFTAVISSALLLLFSLWRHQRKMQTNSVKNLSTDAHVKAMKSILSFFLIYSINFTCLVLSLSYSMEQENPVQFYVSLFQHAFPAVHSLILIFSNPKLEKTLLRTLSRLKGMVCMR